MSFRAILKRHASQAGTFFASLLIAGAVALTGCTANTTKSGAVGVKRSQLLLVSQQELQNAAEKSYREVIDKAKAAGTLDRDPAMVNRVRRIVQRLIPQTRHFRSDAPRWRWEAHVIDSDEVNAWVMPGGKIVVYSGIIRKLNLTDDELAAILGHEIAHALREHARERTSQAVAANLAIDLGAILLGIGQGGRDLASLAYQLTVGLPFSRLHEKEADLIGVELAARAGYDPYAAVNVWKKMEKLGGASVPELLSTHPSHATRIRELQKAARKVYPLYQQARRG